MPITPVIPITGLAGWNFLQSSLTRQTELFNRSPDIQRDVDYFTENIGSVETLDDLISDRRLLRVSLGAFGLDEELNKGALVRRVLEEGTEDRTAFAVRLNNTNYLNYANVFTFDDEGNFQPDDGFIDQVVSQYRERQFEIELDEVDPNLRLASNFEREIVNIANTAQTVRAGWFRVLGSTPLREVVEDVFNLPSSFSQLDLDRQVEILETRSLSTFGTDSVEGFQDPDNVDRAIQRFFLQRQIESGPSASTPGATALTLLGGGLGSAGIANLILSNA